MFDLAKRPWRRLGRTTTGVVSLAVVATSMVALAAAGSADASPQVSAAPRAKVQAVPSASLSAASLLDQAKYTSSIRGTDAKGRKVTGRFVPRRALVNSHGSMVVVGHVIARIHRANGTSFVRQAFGVRLPVKSTTPPSNAPAAQRLAATTNCQILNLVLGPVNLNLLGLVVHLNTVHLNITAVPGAGNLLGNLLCAVAGLLDNTPLSGLLTQLSSLLTSIFAILRA